MAPHQGASLADRLTVWVSDRSIVMRDVPIFRQATRKGMIELNAWQRDLAKPRLAGRDAGDGAGWLPNWSVGPSTGRRWLAQSDARTGRRRALGRTAPWRPAAARRA